MTANPQPRKPRVFTPDDPSILTPEPEPADTTTKADAARRPAGIGGIVRPTRASIERGFAWGSMLLSAASALMVMALGLWFTRFVSIAITREDWVGWVAFSLFGLVSVAVVGILLREMFGLLRLARLARLRRDIDAVLKSHDRAAEIRAARRLRTLYAGRDELKWGLARLKDHTSDVRDPGDILRLADREVVAPLDPEARRIVMRAMKRVSVVTAMSPMAWIAMTFVLFENLAMLRKLATLYGGRPGFLGSLRMLRLVVAHIIATGGLALTDDLLGQFLGQDILRRLSQRLGEGAFNGALTARVGAAAVEVTRPLPFLDATPLRARDFVAELFRKQPEEGGAGEAAKTSTAA